MKNLLFLFILLPLIAHGEVFTVSNNPDSPAEYADLQTALNDIDPGDTIILTGSPTSYGSITSTRSFVLLGPGWNPQDGHKAVVNKITMRGSSSNSVISGLEISQLEAEGSFDNIIVRNCHFTHPDYSIYFPNHDNVQIYGNYINGGRIALETSSDNALITSNIIKYSRYSSYFGVLSTASNTTLFLNNIIFNPFTDQLFYGCNGAFIANNIFVFTSSESSADPNIGCTGCSFTKNITYSTYRIDIPDLPGPGNFGGNNWNDTDPEFVNLPNDATTFSMDHDYHLEAISPGKDSGTDGTDVGIYGRNYEFPLRGYNDIPRIYNMNIENPVVLADSNLNVVVESTTTTK